MFGRVPEYSKTYPALPQAHRQPRGEVHIELCGNGVGDAGAASLAQAAARNKCIVSLNLRDNTFGSTGGTAFATTLRVGP